MATMTPVSGGLNLPKRRGWTRAEYECAIDLGLFGPDERLELIEGEIIEKMTHNSPHATGICLAQTAMAQVFTAGYLVRSQLPLAVDALSEPEPDVAVVRGSVRDYARNHPATAVLVIEVSDSTLPMDRTVKASLYARAGIEEYWIVNINDRVLEVHRQPAAMSEQPLGYHYRSITRQTETESIAPLAAPQALIAVADLLP